MEINTQVTKQLAVHFYHSLTLAFLWLPLCGLIWYTHTVCYNKVKFCSQHIRGITDSSHKETTHLLLWVHQTIFAPLSHLTISYSTEPIAIIYSFVNSCCHKFNWWWKPGKCGRQQSACKCIQRTKSPFYSNPNTPGLVISSCINLRRYWHY